MKIAVNTRFLLTDKLEGIGIYTQEIFKRVVTLMPEHEFYFLFDRPFSDEFIFAKNITPVVISPPARHPFLWYWWFEKSVPKFLKENNIDVFISPDGYASLTTDIPQIITIHDLGFEHFPKHVPFLVRKYYQYFTPKFCKKATKILAVSEFTKQDIVAHYGIDEKKIEITYNGFEIDLNTINESDNTLNEFKRPPYFIFVGAVHPRKNVLGLLKAFELFKTNSSANHMLLIIGRKAWMNDELEQFLNQMKFKDSILWLSNVDRKEVLQLMQNAFALVYPSFFEGFGIPIIEAMSLGVPVITSNISSMPEVAGNAGILVNPVNITDIANAMHSLVENEALRTDLIAKGKIRAQDFDWNVSASKVVDVIKKSIKHIET
ncbi:MAG: glycosyltransferase family 1 protein [Chitinophagales bacterium]